MPADSKTEAPTPKRRQQARDNGQVARSIEVNTAVSLLAAWLVMRAFGGGLIDSLRAFLTTSFESLPTGQLTDQTVRTFGIDTIVTFVRLMAPIAAILALAGFVANVLQVGFHFTPAAIRPRFSKLSPIAGAQRLFTLRSLQELIKSLVKLGVVGFMAFQAISNHTTDLMLLTGGDIRAGLATIGSIVMELLLKVALVYVVLAAADYMFQRWQFEKSLKMTKQEVKEEARSAELAPQIRSRIRSLQRQLARKRMMQRVPEADVVITNPTHFAVALQYDASKMAAPRVVAKGQRLIAEQIKALARQHGIPLVENKPLAQALYKSVDVDQEIPRQLYKAVAEVLAFIYRLKQRAS